MSDYWKCYWDEHTSNIKSKTPAEQVLRVKNKMAQPEESIIETILHIEALLELNEQCDVLDLCCGNGLISKRIALESRVVYGIDFCESLIDVMKQDLPKNVSCKVGDIDNIELKKRFNRVLCAAALQHFSQKQTVRIFEKVYNCLEPSGIFVVTDVLDVSKKWSFYNSEEREKAYFDHIKVGKPILGTWFDTTWLTKLGKYVGFKSMEIITQPESLIYSKYRVDVKCVK